MGSLWLVFGEIDLIFRSNLTRIDEKDEIGLKNRSKLVQGHQMGSLWLGFGEIDKSNERNEGYEGYEGSEGSAKREDRSEEMKCTP